MDDDLAGMSREALIEEVRKLRQGIRAHRDSTGQELCWHHPALWGLLPSGRIRCPRSRTGRSSCAAACVIASRWTADAGRAALVRDLRRVTCR